VQFFVRQLQISERKTANTPNFNLAICIQENNSQIGDVQPLV